MRRIVRLGRFPLLAALALVGAQTAAAAVTAVSLTVSKAVFDGDCPAKVLFAGSITVNAPGTVTYVFTRSDGGIDTITKSLTFTAAGTKPVSTTWTLGGESLTHYSGWEAVKILTPAPMESSHASFQLNCDPPLNSVRAAHGNTDWHIDTANEFLYGKDMAGHDTAANFAPSGWTKKHMHVSATNTAHFYNDSTVGSSGDDADLTSGIDKSMLFFYAGHGNPVLWNTLGNNGSQSGMLLGNGAGSGQLRYYWQCSCEVFAHGPQVCSGGDCDYSAPENFDGSADSASMRNVFQRWGPALGNDLRMACGVSTLAYCHESNVNAIWNDYNNNGMSVAESFIAGLGADSAGDGVKPLCIALGGIDLNASPLADSTFTNRRNTSGNSHFHIMYAGGTQTEPPVLNWHLVPLKLFRIRLIPLPDPPEFQRGLQRIRDIEQFRHEQIAGGAAVVRRNAESGAVHLVAVKRNPKLAATKSDAALRKIALDFTRNLKWVEGEDNIVRTQKILTASVPVKSKGIGEVKRGESRTLVTIQRRVRNGEHQINVLGQGGRVDVLLAPDGQILNAARTWRKAEVTQEEVNIKPFERAREEALARLERTAGEYKLANWRFGYKEHAPNVAQRELKAIYQFDFVPQNFEKLIDFPPRRVEIAAEE